MDHTKKPNNSNEFVNNLRATTAISSPSIPWSNNKDSPTAPTEDDSNEDDADNNTTPDKTTYQLTSKLKTNEVNTFSFAFFCFFVFHMQILLVGLDLKSIDPIYIGAYIYLWL